MPQALLVALLDWLRGLRFPTLAVITAVVFAVNLLIPDFIPMIDELMLGLATLLLASWKKQRAESTQNPTAVERPPIDHQP
jgi:hypothetical protein